MSKRARVVGRGWVLDRGGARRGLLSPTVLLLLLLLTPALPRAAAETTATSAAAGAPAAQLPAPRLRPFPKSLSGDLPYDVDVNLVRLLDARGELRSAQREFDILAWQAFLALNWPAAKDGRPDVRKTPADTAAPRVWSFWRPSETIFLPDGAKPAPWRDGTALGELELFRAKAAWRQTTNSADQNFQAFSGPLVDQNGKWVRYQVLVNREEFDYLFANGLYNLDGQAAFSRRAADNVVDFPAGDRARRRRGAIEIKLAWKELGPNDDRARFFTSRVKVTVSDPPPPGQSGPQVKEIDAGLVGMHIAMHTRSSPEWIWATFEQIDNVRQNRGPHGEPVGPSFRDPARQLPENVLPPKNAIIDPKTGQPVIVNPRSTNPVPTTWVESLTTTPVQVARVPVPKQGSLNPLDETVSADAAALNEEVQAALRAMGSVFQYYELIGTQWPIHPNAPAFAGGAATAPESITHKTPGDVIPVFLVNTTMETYFQKGQQPAGPLEQDDRLAADAPPIDSTPVIGTESCVGCHYSSGICVGFKKAADGSDLFDTTTGQRVPIFGENSHFGRTGNANFSWLLQIEGRALPATHGAGPPPSPAGAPPRPQPRAPARLLDVRPLLERTGSAGARLMDPTVAPRAQSPGAAPAPPPSLPRAPAPAPKR